MTTGTAERRLVLRNASDYCLWPHGLAVPRGWAVESEFSSEAEAKEHLLRVWPRPTEGKLALARPESACPVLARFRQVAQHLPHQVAVRSVAGSVSYQQLDAWSSAIAQDLKIRGASVGRYVAIVCSPSIEGIAAMVGVLKSGATFVPIDPGWPEARRSQVFESIQPVATITTADKPSSRETASTVLLSASDVLPQLAKRPSDGVPDASEFADGVAYTIFTSGSTGIPRGVAVGRSSLWHYVQWASRVYSGARRSALLFSSLSFDLSLTAIFVPLLNGGTIFTSEFDLDEIRRVVGRQQIEFLKVTPSQLELLEFFPAAALPSSQLVIGGEQLFGRSIPERMRTATTIVNEYGPTEATVGCIYHTLSDGDFGPNAVPIGTPAPAVGAYVLDDQLNPVTDGERGELYISGPGLARGYVNDPLGTASKFIADALGSQGSRMYKTGDIVSLDHGCLTFVGRVDNQVKVAGYRIETAEIEAVLRRFEGVGDVHVKPWGEGSGRKLVAYYRTTADTMSPPTPRRLRQALSDRLPGYMVPAAFIRLDDFPLTVNGKLDRGGLPDPDFATSPHITGLTD